MLKRLVSDLRISGFTVIRRTNSLPHSARYMSGLLAIPEFSTPTGLTQHEMFWIPVLVLMGYSGLNGSFPQGLKVDFSFASPSTPFFTKPQYSHAKVEVPFHLSAAFHGLLATSRVPRRKYCLGPPREVCSNATDSARLIKNLKRRPQP